MLDTRARVKGAAESSAVAASKAQRTRPDRRARGVGLVLAIVAAFAGLYAVSYPLTDWLAAAEVHVVPSSPAELCYLALAAIGVALTIAGRRQLGVPDLALAIMLAAPVWLAIQVPYWENGWTPYIPYYEPTLHAAEAAFVTLGGIVLARRWHAVLMPTAERRYRETGRAIALGVIVGLVLAAINVLLFMAQGKGLAASDVPAALLQALKPGILEEVAWRLLFMGLVIVVLRDAVGGTAAAIVAISLSAAFHAAIHVPDLVVSNPLAALGMTVLLGLVFGVPFAVLAHRRGIEASIAGHWTVDAVRFSVGL